MRCNRAEVKNKQLRNYSNCLFNNSHNSNTLTRGKLNHPCRHIMQVISSVSFMWIVTNSKLTLCVDTNWRGRLWSFFSIFIQERGVSVWEHDSLNLSSDYFSSKPCPCTQIAPVCTSICSASAQTMCLHSSSALRFLLGSWNFFGRQPSQNSPTNRMLVEVLTTGQPMKWMIWSLPRFGRVHFSSERQLLSSESRRFASAQKAVPLRRRAEAGAQEICARNNLSECKHTVWAEAQQI